MEQHVIDKLYEDLKVDQKPGQGFKYVKTKYVLDRLNKAFNCNWGLEILEHKVIDDEVLVLASLRVYDDEGRVLAKQDGFGSAKKFRGVDLGNVFKSATSKAIKSAARNWGVGLFLEEGDDDESDSSTSTSFTPSMPKTAMPNSTTGTAFPMGATASVDTPPSFSSTPPTPPTGKQSTPNVPGGMSNTAIESVAEEVAKVLTPTSGSVPSVPSVPSGPSVLPKMTAVPGSMPSTPNTPSSEKGAEHALTMVQKVAINTRLSAKNVSFEEAAKEFYATRESSIPESLDTMLYSDALDMVTFLNSK